MYLKIYNQLQNCNTIVLIEHNKMIIIKDDNYPIIYQLN